MPTETTGNTEPKKTTEPKPKKGILKKSSLRNPNAPREKKPRKKVSFDENNLQKNHQDYLDSYMKEFEKKHPKNVEQEYYE